MGGNNDFFENFERNIYWKKLPSMQRVNGPTDSDANSLNILQYFFKSQPHPML